MSVIHIDGQVVHDCTVLMFPREPRWRKVTHFAWWSFLAACAVHQIFFAGYDATLLTNILNQLHRMPHTNIDTLGVTVAITKRTLLAKIFFDKLFDWPLPDGVTEQSMRVNIVISRQLEYEDLEDSD